MNRRNLALALSVLLLNSILVGAEDRSEEKYRRVLPISVDGLHAIDVARFIENHPNSALAELARHGLTYSNARTPANSDSFSGLRT
jgi:hypothetical protein